MLLREMLASGSPTCSVRDAIDADSVCGVPARYVACPADEAQVAAVMAAAADHQLAVVVRGAATKLDWGNPPERADLILDVSGLAEVLEHNAGDLVVRVQPGVKLAELQATLAPSGQRLAVDEVVPGSTIGGIISTGLSGPSRFLYGGVRDLLIGVTVVRADGVLARGGGRVVKNVAGYDLCKLYTGSYGTLGVVTEAIFRLHPLPESSVYVSVAVPDAESARSSAAAVLGSQLQPSAVEMDWPSHEPAPTLCVLLEGSSSGVAARVERLSPMLHGDIAANAEPPAWWGKLPGGVTVKLTSPIALIHGLLAKAANLGAHLGVPLAFRGSLGAGVIYAGFAADVGTGAAARLVTGLRAACEESGGFAVVPRATSDIKSALDVWGPAPALELMKRVKDNFDPGHRLAPGRFVGGI